MGDDADGSNWTETPCGEEPPCHFMNATEWERTWWRGATIGKHRAAFATDVDAVMAPPGLRSRHDVEIDHRILSWIFSAVHSRSPPDEEGGSALTRALFNHVSVAMRAQNLLARDNPWRIAVAPRSRLVPRSIKASSFVSGCALTLYTCFGAFCSVGSKSLSTAPSPNLRCIHKTRSRYIAFMADRRSQTCSCRQSNTTGRQRAELIAFIRCHGRLQTCECALAAAPPVPPVSLGGVCACRRRTQGVCACRRRTQARMPISTWRMHMEERLNRHDATLDLHEAALAMLHNDPESARSAMERYESATIAMDATIEAQTEPAAPRMHQSSQTAELDELAPIWAVWDMSSGRYPDLEQAHISRRHRLGLRAESTSSSSAARSVTPVTRRRTSIDEMRALGRACIESSETPSIDRR